MRDLKQSIKGLAAGLRARELDRSEQVQIAKIVDTSPHAIDGFIICRLIDGTNVNVHAWTAQDLAADMTVAITRISQRNWNTYLLLAVNATTDAEVTPFSVPPIASGGLPVHGLSGDRHSGTLPWARIDTASTQVDLTDQVSGQLPLANQVLQLGFQTVTLLNTAVAGSATASGNVDAAKRALVVGVRVSGGTAFTLKLSTDAAHALTEYLTFTGTVCPYADPAIWYHGADASKLYYDLTNTGSTATFLVEVDLLVIEP